MIQEIFAPIYETWFQLYDLHFKLIFDTLFDDGGYTLFGLSFILIPLVLWLLFYYVWNYPYGNFWYWLVWLIFTFLVVAVTTLVIANNEIFASNNQELNNALANTASGYEEFAETLPIKFAFINGILTIVMGCVYSLILKQFSDIQMHLPF